MLYLRAVWISISLRIWLLKVLEHWKSWRFKILLFETSHTLSKTIANLWEAYNLSWPIWWRAGYSLLCLFFMINAELFRKNMDFISLLDRSSIYLQCLVYPCKTKHSSLSIDTINFVVLIYFVHFESRNLIFNLGCLLHG